MLKQRTIKQAIDVQGIGLHSGQTVNMRFLPHEIDGGIVFRRVDLTPVVEIPANAVLIQEAFMCSNLVQENAKVGTIEHVMSAFMAVGIDNIIVEVDASELPIVDGSAKPFVEALLKAGLLEQHAPKKFIKIIKPVQVEIGDKTASFTPYDGFQVNFKIEFNHPIFTAEHQFYQFDLTTADYVQQIAPARTFGFKKDLDMLQSKNLALGASLENAIGLDETSVLNPEGLRFENEFVRHKILDAIGDLSLLGHQILGKFDGFKAGHAVNNALLRQVLQDKSVYEIVTFDEDLLCPISYVTV